MTAKSKMLLISAVMLSAIVFGACAGSKPGLTNSDPADSPDVVTQDLDSFNAQKDSFTLRIKNFNIVRGEWAKADMGIVELERAAINHLEHSGYAYTPDPEKSRYNIEFHLTCYDPAGGPESSRIPYHVTQYPNDLGWGPYPIEHKTYVFTISSGEVQNVRSRSCAGRMLLLIRDREEGAQGPTYAGHHSLAPPCPYEQGCAFSTCLEAHKDAVLRYLDIEFPE